MRGSVLAVLAVCVSMVGNAFGYIAVPASRLTLCEVMLEFPHVVELELAKSDSKRGAYVFEVVEVFQGNLKGPIRLALLEGNKTPMRLMELTPGDRIVAFLGSPDNRSLFFAKGGWFLTQPNQGWERFNQFRDDFQSLFVGTPRDLADAVRELKRGGRVTVSIQPEGVSDRDRLHVSYDAEYPHRRWPALPPKDPPWNAQQARAFAESKSSADRTRAMLTLGGMDRTEAELRKGLGDSRPEVRLAAIAGLQRQKSSSAETVKELARCLTDEDRFVCGMAAWSLGQLGTQARDALPELQKALRDRDWNHDFRPHRAAEAAEAMLIIAPGSPAAKLAVEFFLSDRMLNDQRKDSEGTRTAAARALGRVGRAAESALPTLVKALKDDLAETRIAAAEAVLLVATNEEQRVAAFNLLKAEMLDGQLSTRIQAIRAATNSRASTLLPVLQKLSESADPHIRREAGLAVQRISR